MARKKKTPAAKKEAGVHHATGQPDSAREHAQKSLALCEQHALADLRKEVEALLGRVEK